MSGYRNIPHREEGNPPPVIAVVTGMRAEAALLPGLKVVCSGGNADRARQQARRLLADGAQGLLSFGIAGGLAMGMRPGRLVVASSVAVGDERIPCHEAWTRNILSQLPEAEYGIVAGVLQAATTPAAKRHLHSRSGALAVDMESAVVAEACLEAGRPFAVLRAIADPAERSVPASALAGLAEDGSTRAGPVLVQLLRRPGDLPRIIGLGLASRTALAALRLATGRLGPSLGFELA